MNDLVPVERIEKSILLLRGQKIMLDATLADLYGVTTKRLNEQVKRNRNRFPEDFMFQLSFQEAAVLRSHIATSTSGHGGRRTLPNVFTEHGVIMAATVLNSPRAIEVSLLVVRAFVRLRQFLASHKELASKLAELERRLGTPASTENPSDGLRHASASQAVTSSSIILPYQPEDWSASG